MMRDRLPASDDEADIVIAAIQEVLILVALTHEQQAQIERNLKARFGDRRIRVKKKLQLSLEDPRRLQVYQDGLTNMSTEEIARKHSVSQRTVYYWMKKGNPAT